MAKRVYSAKENAQWKKNIKQFSISTGQDPKKFGKLPWTIFDPGKGDPWRELCIVDADGIQVTTLGSLQDPTDMTLGNALHIIKAVNNYKDLENSFCLFGLHKRTPTYKIAKKLAGKELLGTEFNRLTIAATEVAHELLDKLHHAMYKARRDHKFAPEIEIIWDASKIDEIAQDDLRPDVLEECIVSTRYENGNLKEITEYVKARCDRVYSDLLSCLAEKIVSDKVNKKEFTTKSYESFIFETTFGFCKLRFQDYSDLPF